MKRFSFVLLIIVLSGLILTSCAATSPAQYSNQMTPVLKDFNNWYTGDLDMYHQLLAAKCKLDPTLTYGDLVMGTVYTYRIGKGVSPSKSWNAADIQLFQTMLEMMHDSAVNVLDEITKISPPAEIKDAHTNLKNCLQYQKDISESLLSIFLKGTYTDLTYQTNPCDGIQTSYDLVNQYVNQNGTK